MRALRLLAGGLAALPLLIHADGAVPLGDGKVSRQPAMDYVFSCETRFPESPRPGATPWIHGNTWQPSEKPTVRGNVPWQWRLTVQLQGNQRVLMGNNLPSHGTGEFPIRQDDPVYRYDRNPNSIAAQDLIVTLPANPQEAATPSCVPMGAIGYALTGATIFNALDAAGLDAPAHEVQDRCGGHPAMMGDYHYHSVSDCVSHEQAGKHSELVGYMLDGFGLYGPHGEHGEELSNADLDACHGHTHMVTWDGQPRRMYHYHATRGFPYTVGCFKGTPIQTAQQRRGPPPGGRPFPPPPGGQRPPGPPPPPFP